MENLFLYKIEREELENNVKIISYYIDENCKKIIKEDFMNYEILANEKQFLEKKIELEKLNIKKEDKIFYNLKKEKVVKLIFETKESFIFFKGFFKENFVETYELDLIFEHKYLINNDVKIAQNFNKKNLNYLCFDIETIGEIEKDMKIISISAYSRKEDFKKVYFNYENLNNDKVEELKKETFSNFEVLFFENEKDMLLKFKEDVLNFDPFFITGWNVIDFDFKILKNRFDKYEIDFNLSKHKGEIKFRIVRDFFKESILNFPSILVFDSIYLLKKNFINFENYKLTTVAKSVLGDDKIDIFEESTSDENENKKIFEIEKLYLNNPKKLIEYNFKDSKLVSQIIEKLNLLYLFFDRSIFSQTPIQKVNSPIACLDVLFLKKLHKKNIVANSNFSFGSENPISGAHIFSPEKGFYKNIFIFDFKSLYPSLIMTYNICPSTFSKLGKIISPNGARFLDEEGILPKLILDLYELRNEAKKNKDKIRSYAIKINMNSFYGAMASPKCRFYNFEIGEAITSFSKQTLIETKKFIEENNFGKVIYGDTDSCFVKIKEKNLNQNIQKEISQKVNVYFSKKIFEKYKRKSFLNLESEKKYDKFFIASKKRYVGFNLKNKEFDFVGMEYVRGDWTKLARNFQKKILEIIFLEKENLENKLSNFIKGYISKLKNKEFDNELVYLKKLTKDLTQYTKTTPPHVKAAREVKGFKGRIVKYVMSETGPKHISFPNCFSNIDYNHYIEKQLKGVSDDILSSLNFDFDKLAGLDNKGLTNFF